jgi:hypothetical protein
MGWARASEGGEMSDKFELTIIAATRLLHPFYVADAIFDAWLHDNAEEKSIGFTRQSRTSGSVFYHITKANQVIGSFFLWALSAQRTVITLYAAQEMLQETSEWMISTRQTILAWHENEVKKVAAKEKAHAERNRPGTTKPQMGDSVDAWLDWRDAERKSGRRWTLDQLVKESGWSISTFKKQSASRKPRGRGNKR